MPNCPRVLQKNEFVIVYVGKPVPMKSLKKASLCREYLMKVGDTTIDISIILVIPTVGWMLCLSMANIVLACLHLNLFQVELS
jgi:hypothetical protein